MSDPDESRYIEEFLLEFPEKEGQFDVDETAREYLEWVERNRQRLTAQMREMDRRQLSAADGPVSAFLAKTGRRRFDDDDPHSSVRAPIAPKPKAGGAATALPEPDE